MYLVYYQFGAWGDSYTRYLFATDSLDFAEKYIKKFNRILKKAKNQYEELYYKNNDKWLYRFPQADETTEANYEQIEFRNELKSKI